MSLFLEVADLPPIEIIESESPDFVLVDSERRIGIELTELFRPPVGTAIPPRAQENLTDRIVSAARRIYETETGNFVHVNVCFFEGVNVRTINRDQTARSLSDLVRRLSLTQGVHAHWRNDYENSTLDAIAFVSALPVPQASMAHWSVARAGWRATLSQDVVTEAIAAKNHKLPAYRSNLDEVWLLLAIEGSRPSQFFDPDNIPNIGQLGSAFDRTYFFNSVHRKVSVWTRSDA